MKFLGTGVDIEEDNEVESLTIGRLDRFKEIINNKSIVPEMLSWVSLRYWQGVNSL